MPFMGRLVCATNADLTRRVEEGAFREDLLYRINVLTVSIPPLRERAEDAEWLAERFVEALSADAGVELSGLTASALSVIRAHAWPGNARELRNRIERAVALAPGPWITPGDLFPDRHRDGKPEVTTASLESARDEAERREILNALRRHEGVIGKAAAALGISRTTMWEKMRRHRIEASS